MDSYYIDGSDGDSRLPSRSRSNSHLSSTTSRFQDLDIKPSIKSSNEEEERVSKGPTTTTTTSTSTASTFLDPDPQPSSTTFIVSPAPKQVTPFPEFSQAELDANWLFAEPEDTTGPTPIVRLDPVQNLPSSHSLGSQPHISRSNSFPASMSTIGIQNYDPRFDAGIQQSFTWPRFDLGDQFLPQQMSPPMAAGTLTPGYDPKLMPMYARSISSSPPRPNLTPEQRELKRQRDVARRDSKVRMRRDRSTSNPYTMSPQPSPEMLSRSLSEFSNGLTPSPLLSQGSQGSPNMSNISSPAYLSGYTPGLGDPTSSDLYGPAFTMPPDFNAMPAYSMPYSNGSMDSSLQSFMPRPHSLSAGSDQQPNMQHMQNLYQNPSPKMGSSDPADHVRVVHSRPKPQCWEHGCNGRQFSTFSNLLRHQREKSGAATKATCPNCGAEFTRTTARNGHMAHEKLLEARLEQADLLKKVVDAIKDLVQDCNFDCNDSGVALQAMDNSHVALVSMMLKAETFSPYRCDRNVALGVNLTSLTKVLRAAQNEDILTIKAEDAPDVLNLVFESSESDRLSEYDLKLMDIDQEHLGIPDTEYAATITMPSSEFKRICLDLMALSESVSIEATKDGVKFSCAGDIGNGAVTLRSHTNVDKPELNVEIELTEPVSLTFSLKYLVNFCKAAGLSKSVKLCLSNEVPLLVEYALAGSSYLRFYLAPKIGDDE